MLTAQEQDVAKSLVEILRGPKYKDRNYLFLDPFDMSQVPGYLDVVQKALDLRTVATNLEGGQYDNMDTFMEDLNLIFHNAIKYHGSRETKWIAKMAKEMLKIVQREKSRLENPQPKKATLKLKLGKQLPKAGAPEGNQPPSATPSAEASASELAQPTAAPSNPDSAAAAAAAKKPKLKIKMAGAKNPPPKNSSAPPPKAVKAKPTQPKLKLKLSLSKTKATPAGASAEGQPLPSNAQLADPTSASVPAQGTATDEKVEKKKAKVSKKEKVKDKPPKESKKVTVKVNPAGAGGSRGKELPKGVAPPPNAPPPKVPNSTGGASTPKAPAAGTEAAKQRKNKQQTKQQTKQQQAKTKKTHMSPSLYRQCHKVILGLRRRLQKDISWFERPVTDKNIVQDYRAKIKNPMDFSKITTKLENRSYSNMHEFCLDVRRICANCLRYNTSTKDTIRHSAMQVLTTTEDLMAIFLTKPECPPYPRLLYCWKLCVNVLDTLCNIVNPEDGQPTVLYFLHPVDVLYGGQFPPGYRDKVAKPMDFGTVVSNLVEGVYQSVSDFANDCRLIIQNTKTFYGDKEDSKVFVDQAERLDRVLSQQLDQLARYDKSSKAQSDRQKAHIPDISVRKPSPQLLSTLMDDLRALKYSDNATKITEAAMGPFEKPVSLAAYPDYLTHVLEPLDLGTIDKRIKSFVYETPEDFEYDVTLVFRNCEVYNSKRNGDHFVKMAKYATRHFRRIFGTKIKALEESPPSPAPGESFEMGEPAAKKAKIDPSVPAGGAGSKGKTAPRITLSSAAVNAAARASNKSPRPQSAASQKKSGKPPASNQPLPLHIAISRVKEAFPLRRAIKNLQAMEADLAKYLKDLMRHPWLSAARPKFIFHVPVCMLFPELKDAYAVKIKKPMDLTTVECTLLAGNRYTSPEDFLQDVALTFSNAIKFNKDGRDIGDAASSAYYDASVHLLRYARWLSLEQLSNYVEDSDHVDEQGPTDGLPPLQWKLTSANQAKAREEQKTIVLDETIERSLEGDRWTWHEAECEKLLKALRHQSDNKHMKFFVHSDYPPNYTAFIAKPMDWEKVQKKLRKRQYEKFGEIIEDLRLIFENAKKYNGRFTDPTSQAAYSAAVHMADKLENAIRRLMLSVSDRIERERIDHANAEREEEAFERAEEARIRAEWKKEHEGDGTAPPLPSRAETLQKIRLRKTVTRREDADFEIPFFDDENSGQHERSYFEVIKFQRSMFEKQRLEMSKMRSMAAVISGSFHGRMLQRTFAQEWVGQERKKGSIGSSSGKKMDVDLPSNQEKESAEIKPSAVLEVLEKNDRPQMKLVVAPVKKRPKKRPLFSFE